VDFLFHWETESFVVVHSSPSPCGLAFLAPVVVVVDLAAMASEIEIVTEGLLQHQHQHQQKENGLLLQTKEDEDDRKKEDIYTAAAYGDMEKLLRLVQRPGGVFSITQPDAGGYFALHWSALNNRFSVAEYLLQVVLVLSFLCRILLTSCCKQLSRSLGQFLCCSSRVEEEMGARVCMDLALGCCFVLMRSSCVFRSDGGRLHAVDLFLDFCVLGFWVQRPLA
jgi:hypothetical protein